MKKEYDLLVFIGRFQPLHLGHERVIDIALERAEKVLVLVGSAYSSRRPRNPFTFDEREAMIRLRYPDNDRLIISPLPDFTYRDEMWIEEVQFQASMIDIDGGNKIGLIGCSKDHTSYYLNLFPQWGSINVEFLNPLNSTDIRNAFFYSGNVNEYLSKWVISEEVHQFLANFQRTQNYLDLMQYYEFCEKSKARRQHGTEYPVQDLCADAVVTQSGHVLLVERKHHPGKGLFALPGGYLNPTERWVDCAIRELKEETGIKVPEQVLRGSIVNSMVADDPNRSERGRIVTQAFHIKLKDGPLPKVKGSDDAAKAFWVPLANLDSEKMFEDHYSIIRALL